MIATHHHPRPFRGASLAALSVAATALLLATEAYAAGLYLAPRGVRPLARGGSFVAGADDLNALSYNPAGMSESGTSLLVDFALPVHTTRYTRRVHADGPEVGTVQGQGLGMPSPTLGAIVDPGWAEGLRLGLSLAADVPLLQNWPMGDEGREPAAQRYAIKSYDGTALSKLSAGVSYAIGPYVSVGASLQALFGTFASQSTLSNCDGTLCTEAERPDYDADIQMISRNLVVPGAQVGLLVKPTHWLRLGLAWESGYKVSNDAELRIRLPSAASFDNAVLDPEVPQGRVTMRMPQQVRGGIEVRLDNLARLETSFVWEQWSVHESIRVSPGDVQMTGLPPPLNDYSMGPMAIQRGFRDTWSARVGTEITPPLSARGLHRPLALRFGVMYEPSAIPDEALTAMSVDLDKVLLATGAAYTIGRFHIDATYGYVLMQDRTVSTSTVLQSNPTRPPWDGRTPIGNGDYASDAHLFGLGLRVDI